MKLVFEPSAQDFLDAQRGDNEFQVILDHLLDEANSLALDPAIDGETKLAFETPIVGLVYRIFWGRSTSGRSFWYVYEPDYDRDVLRVYNIGHAGLEAPFLSRR